MPLETAPLAAAGLGCSEMIAARHAVPPAVTRGNGLPRVRHAHSVAGPCKGLDEAYSPGPGSATPKNSKVKSAKPELHPALRTCTR